MTGRDDEVRLLRAMHRDAVALARSDDRLLASQYAELAGQIEALLIINESDPDVVSTEAAEPCANGGSHQKKARSERTSSEDAGHVE